MISMISYDEEATFTCFILFLLYQLPWTDSLQIRQTDRQADSVYVTFLFNHFSHVFAGWVMYILHSNLHKILHKKQRRGNVSRDALVHI